MPRIATKGDKVVGTDMHVVMVPSPGGPVPTPLPHTFRGTIISGCEETATINGKPIAVIGAEAVNDTPHVPTPPGTSFQTPPKNKSKIVSTITTIEINGKYLVVEGSPAMNCNDPADAPTGVVQVEGCSVEWEPVTDWKPIPRFDYQADLKESAGKREKMGNTAQDFLTDSDSSVQPRTMETEESGQIVSMVIPREYLYYGEPIPLRIKKRGKFNQFLTVRRIIMDSHGDWVDVRETCKFQFGKEDEVIIRLAPWRVSRDKIDQIPSDQRLYVYLEIVHDGETIYRLAQQEITEIIARVHIMFRYKKTVSMRVVGKTGLTCSFSTLVKYKSDDAIPQRLQMDQVPLGSIQLSRKNTRYAQKLIELLEGRDSHE